MGDRILFNSIGIAMIIHYHKTTGEIIRAALKKDYFFTYRDANAGIYEVDEIDDNIELCMDIINTQALTNQEGFGKYYIENEQLFMREGWTEWQPL